MGSLNSPLRLIGKPTLSTYRIEILMRRTILYGSLRLCLLLLVSGGIQAQDLGISIFQADATPPIGSPAAYAPTRSIQEPLSARGIVIFSDEDPIVFCTLDWLGIANEGQDRWKKQLAKAAKTTPDRVFVHALHQHDGLRCDFTSAKILTKYGLKGKHYDLPLLKSVIKRTAKAVSLACKQPQSISHLGYGMAKVEKVASNRRLLGEEGKVERMRWSKSTDPIAIAAPEGLIDPWLRCVSFWQEETPLAVLTYYATHPQSYYGQGDVNPEFVGMARKAREQALNDLPHIHFNGAGGNVAAGKYNDGSPDLRPILAGRMEAGMKQAWEQSQKVPISSQDLDWRTEDILLPPGKHLIEEHLLTVLEADTADHKQKLTAAKHLAWLRRTQEGHAITVSSLRLGKVWLLNLPGELFIEYQLAAQKMRPNDQVCTAAYGEYGPGYIGTRDAYPQGGYEVSERASRVAPEVEEVLMEAIRKVLK